MEEEHLQPEAEELPWIAFGIKRSSNEKDGAGRAEGIWGSELWSPVDLEVYVISMEHGWDLSGPNADRKYTGCLDCEEVEEAIVELL